MTRRCIPAVLAFVMAVAAACGDASTDTATSGDDAGSTDDGVVVEGVDRDDGDADDGGSDGVDGDTDPGDDGSVSEVPDIDDLNLDDGSGVTFELTGDPCVDMLSLVVGSTAEAMQAMPEDDQAALLRRAAEPFGDDATAAVDALIEQDDLGPDDEFDELLTAFDAITLEPCGWPLFGALVAVAAAQPVVFCEVDEAIGVEPAPDDGPAVHPDPACDQDGIAPTSLPCFEAIEVDRDSFFEIGERWATVDCDSGAPVEWDGQVGAWVETTDAVAAPDVGDEAPG